MEAKLIGSLLVESATSAFSRYEVRPNMLPAITVCAADSIRVNADIDNAVAMAMMNGLTSAIVNPNDLRLMETIKSCDVFKGNTLYADSYLEI